jgi:tetratricopeptide (TPR) repeat protein
MSKVRLGSLSVLRWSYRLGCQGGREKTDVEPRPTSPFSSEQGREKEKARVNSLAPIGGEGARRAGEGSILQGLLLAACVVLWFLRTVSFSDLPASPKMGPISARSLAANPPEISALMNLLEKQLRLKQYQTARETTQKLQGLLKPEDARFLEVASLLAVHEQYSVAIPLLEQARAVSPKSYDVNYNLALAYFHNANHSRSAETLQALLAHQPRAEAYNLLAQVEEQRKRFLEAVRAFQKAAELEPGNEDYRFDYGYELLQHQTDRAAIAILASGVRDFPSSLKLRLGLGCAYYVADNEEEAAQTLLAAIKIEPGNKLAYLLLGKTYKQAGSLQVAVAEAFKAYLERVPSDPWAYYHYGTILYLNTESPAKPDFQEAKSCLRRALTLNPHFAEAFVQLAIILQAEDQNRESVSLLGQAVQSNPRLASAHYRLGVAYRGLGEKDKAAGEFALFERLKAEDQAGREKRKVIQFLVQQRE